MLKLGMLGLVWTQWVNRRYVTRSGLVSNDHFVGLAWTGGWTKGALLDILDDLPPGCTELMVHPGKTMGLAQEPTRLVESREEELRILTDPEIKQRCCDLNVRLENYRDLSAKAR